MPSCARREIIDDSKPGVYHIYSRVARQAFLCGFDRASGIDYSYRKDWVEELIRTFQAIFLIDVFCSAILDNHFHMVVRNRPDLVEKCSDEEIVRRALMLCPIRKSADGEPEPPTNEELERYLRDSKFIKKWRKRLSSISWYNKLLKERIAKRANREDGVTGVFWDGRFHSIRLLDSIAVLLCSMYVDLNEIRAGKTNDLLTSKRSSVFHRIQSWMSYRSEDGLSKTSDSWSEEELFSVEPAPDWLSPINECSGTAEKTLTMTSEKPVLGQTRPSNTGFLPMTLTQYFQLCDWAGRSVRAGKRGSIPKQLEPIMSRLTANLDVFLDYVQRFRKVFRKFCGSPEQLTQARKNAGAKRVNGLTHARALYPTT